ncbi:NADH-ubiquinone oxidoreductase chain 4L-like [Dioscorea cayenensis subsp. rotundata]|uniref:NADH-ubiquinone oxidoreductase chain 4L-like n=1 Tax=Dioscorea cayennensis subsp. rotundata TaxID=55577 RepID=A0AB40BY83_DIOCR|nr:NADH-ubiquinone oxidoreductase chain 4L-like [Dioscorea cayenensis subsp. rotundata]
MDGGGVLKRRSLGLKPELKKPILRRKTGIRGILLNRRNILIMSMPIESMLLAVNSNFLVFSVSLDDMMGQSFASLVPTVAAAESAIGSAIFVITFRVRGTIAVESINCIQG